LHEAEEKPDRGAAEGGGHEKRAFAQRGRIRRHGIVGIALVQRVELGQAERNEREHGPFAVLAKFLP
jgi:hypothetical protein